MMKRINGFLDRIDAMKYADIVRYFIDIVLCMYILDNAIQFTNAGSNYEQALYFRPICIACGLIIIVNMDIKRWLNIFSVIYVPVCYIATHYGYEKHIIPDLNNYQYVEIIRTGKLVALVWGIIIINILIDVIAGKTYKKWRRLNIVPAAVLALFIIFVLVFRKEYYDMLFMTIEIPAALYILGNEKRRHYLVRSAVDALMLSFIYVALFSLRHRPYDCERYSLNFCNTNMCGAYLACVAVAVFTSLSVFWNRQCKKWLKITGVTLHMLFLGFVLSTIMFNNSRTVILALLFSLFVLFICELLRSDRKASVWLKYILALLSLPALFYPTFLAYRYIPAYYAAHVDQPLLYDIEYDPEVRVMFGDAETSPKYTSLESYFKEMFGKWGIIIDFEDEDGEGDSLAKKLGEAELDGRDVTTGRTDIWRLFIPKFNATGHFPGYVVDDNGEIIPHAHNSYFTMTYQLGLIVGILYAILCIMVFILGIRKYIKSGPCTETMFAFLMSGTMLIAQVSEWLSRPQYSIFIVYIFVLTGLLYKSEVSSETEKIADEDKK